MKEMMEKELKDNQEIKTPMQCIYSKRTGHVISCVGNSRKKPYSDPWSTTLGGPAAWTVKEVQQDVLRW